MEFVSKYDKQVTDLRNKLREVEALIKRERATKEEELLSKGWVLIHVDEDPYEMNPEIHFLLSPEVDEEIVERARTQWFDFEEEGITKDQYFI